MFSFLFHHCIFILDATHVQCCTINPFGSKYAPLNNTCNTSAMIICCFCCSTLFAFVPSAMAEALCERSHEFMESLPQRFWLLLSLDIHVTDIVIRYYLHHLRPQIPRLVGSRAHLQSSAWLACPWRGRRVLEKRCVGQIARRTGKFQNRCRH